MQYLGKPALLSSSLLVIASVLSAASMADSIGEALAGGKAYGDFRLRFEAVEQDNDVEDASALTLRSRLGYSTGVVGGFSALLELEDTRIVSGEGEYTVGPTRYQPGQYSVIADPETTELDQAFIQYKTDSVVSKLGRQVLTFDNHRFIGHVGWRQDRQTFDAFNTTLSLGDNVTIQYAYVGQHNRIFAEDADIDSKDHLFNVAVTTPVGKLTGYAYLLEEDNDTDNVLDTYGVRLSGQTSGDSVVFIYTAEYASQESEAADIEFDAEYMLLEGGIAVGGITTKLAIEVLGSDDGLYGFATPLATMHKFNGWADLFLATPAQGLVDTSVSVGGKLAGGAWSVIYHEFEADEETDTLDDLGDEIDVVYSRKFGKHYNAGIKYAAYSAGDVKVDTDKLWFWVGVTF
jgi:Alginate export